MVAIGQVCQQENLNRTIVLHIEIGYRMNSIYFRIKMLALNLFFFFQEPCIKTFTFLPMYVQFCLLVLLAFSRTRTTESCLVQKKRKCPRMSVSYGFYVLPDYSEATVYCSSTRMQICTITSVSIKKSAYSRVQ